MLYKTLTKLFWPFLALVVLVCVGLVLQLKNLHIESDMMALLPKTEHSAIKEEAFRRVSKEASQKIIILISGESPDEALDAANHFYNKVATQINPQQITLRLDEASQNEFLNYVFKNRFALLSTTQRELLKNKQGFVILEDAIRQLHSPVSGNAFSQSASQIIKQDPFFLSQSFLLNNQWLNGNLTPYKGVLMAEDDEDLSYAFMTITIPAGDLFSIEGPKKLMSNIQVTKEKTLKTFKRSDFIILGVPVYSQQAAKNSNKEISLIAWISSIGVILLIWLAFRSFFPLGFSVLSIAVGMLFAFVCTHLVFGKIHILTLVFGSSISGIAVDYACHYFAEYHHQNQDNRKTIEYIFSAIIIGLLTTILGYLVFFFAPFRALQEIALFSLVSITASFAVVIFAFPKFYKSQKLKANPWIHSLPQRFIDFIQKNLLLKPTLIALAIICLSCLPALIQLRANDDIRALFSPSKELIAQQKRLDSILGQQNSSQFFLLTSQSQEALLQKEEELASKLSKLIDEEELSSFKAISQLVPSEKTQRENTKLIRQELYEPYLETQAKNLALSKADQIGVTNDLANSSKNTIDLNSFLKSEAGNNFKGLWLGKMGNTYASVVLLQDVRNTDTLSKLKNLEQNLSGVYFMNKVGDTSDLLGRFRNLAVWLLALAYGMIFLFLLWRYKIQKSLLILACPILAGLFTLSIMGLLSHTINLFDVMALFLVLGIGIDYAIFYAEAQNKVDQKADGTALAVFLSCVSTLLSFGLLAFSNFNLISSFGLTCFWGILFSYLLSPLVLLHSKPQSYINK